MMKHCLSLVVALCLLGAVAAQAEEQAPSPQPTERFLLVGDSMAWALGLELRELVEADGHKFRIRSKTSDSIRGYAVNHKMKTDIRSTRPDVVIISLGANEALVPRPESLVHYMERIVKEVGDRECYWVGPPMWREDTGVVKLLAEHTGPCQFFNSSPLELERRSDGIHPNREGSRQWAQQVYTWIKERRQEKTPAPQDQPTQEQP